MVSEDSTSNVIVFPVRIFTKVCILADAFCSSGGRPNLREGDCGFDLDFHVLWNGAAGARPIVLAWMRGL
jgi:hypothetical protein